jgi:putative flippase GtrA
MRPWERVGALPLPSPGAMRFGRFALVGLAGTGMYYVVLWSLVELMGVPVLVASSLAFLVVALENYVFHYAWTFRATRPHRSALPRFLGMNVAGFGLNWGVMYAGVGGLGLNYLLVQAVAIALVVAWNFGLSLLWIFPEG